MGGFFLGLVVGEDGDVDFVSAILKRFRTVTQNSAPP
jgi:hypothetical protein